MKSSPLLAMVIAASAAGAPAEPPGETLRAPPLPAIGSETVVGTGLLVARPATPSCTVELFAMREFEGDARAPIDFAPPAGCPGPWSKVVLEADFRVTAGEQFDRTAFINLAGVNLLTGTTMEPGRTRAPQWHVEQDVTDYAALFKDAHAGEALLTNYVDGRYTGRLFMGARLVFYRTSAERPAPQTPDLVLALADKPTQLTAEQPEVERDVTLPRNVERLAIDVMAEPQADDEFWYFCPPDRVTERPKQGGQPPCGAPFRETEIRIDGMLAGFAPAYPWIYTGGVNPRMWVLAPGVEALNLQPYRVDLTPFAGLIDDGKPHRIALRVTGVHRYFNVMGTLMAWLDPARTVVGGALTLNQLKSAEPRIGGRMRLAGEDDVMGKAIVTARREESVAGYVQTSRGRVETRVRYDWRFANRQHGSHDGRLHIDQSATLRTGIRTRGPDGSRYRTLVEHFPLVIDIYERPTGQDKVSDMHFRQGLHRSESERQARWARRRVTRLSVEPRVHMVIPPSGRRDAKGSATTVTRTAIRDSQAGCHDRTVTVKDGRVVAIKEGC
jgi:hypothetical protein